MFDNEKFIGTFTACGNMGTADSQTQQTEMTDSAEDTETSDKDAPAETEKKEEMGEKVLVAYFAYSENMGDTSGMEVDAITSASLFIFQISKRVIRVWQCGKRYQQKGVAGGVNCL